MTGLGFRVSGFGQCLLLSAFCLLLSAFCLLPAAFCADTPAFTGFRGDGLGRYPDATPAIEWDTETNKNILWSVKVGSNPFSSPMLVGGKVFVISKPAQLVCVDADTGKLLWEKPNTFADLPKPTEEKPARGSAGNVASTPASDGQNVYVVFGCGIVASYDLQGQRRWIEHFELLAPSEYGRSASPVLAGGKLLVWIGHLMALDPATGKVLWRAEKVPEMHGTPLVTKIGGVDVVLAPSGHAVRLADGVVLGETLELKYTMPIVHDGVAYFISSQSAAFELPAQAADKLLFKPLWKLEFEGLFYGSAVYHNGLLYIASNEGKFHIIDAKAGTVVVTKDLEIPTRGSPPGMPGANVYPSPTLAGKYLFVSNDAGDTLVLELGREYKVLKHNELPKGSGGSPVFVGKRMYVRGGDKLYCIGEK